MMVEIQGVILKRGDIIKFQSDFNNQAIIGKFVKVENNINKYIPDKIFNKYIYLEDVSVNGVKSPMYKQMRFDESEISGIEIFDVQKVVSILKDSFYDCTFGGEDEDYILYDIGLENAYAHVNISKHKSEIVVKVYDVNYGSDSEPISEKSCDNIKDVISFLKNPLDELLNELTTKFDALYCFLEDGEDISNLNMEELKENVNKLVDFLESIGGRVKGIEYIKE